MPLIQIVCSNCGYAREARSSSLPQKSVNVTCPKCQHVFVFDPANPVQEKSPVSPVTQPPVAPTAEEPASLTGGMGNRANKLSLAELCLTCRQPLQGDYCAVCALELASDRQAVWLSVLFPGLGQIRNGEIQKGLIYCVITVVFLYVAYVGIDGWFFSGADLDARDKARLAVHIALATVWYIANIFDAHHGSIRGRKPVP